MGRIVDTLGQCEVSVVVK